MAQQDGDEMQQTMGVEKRGLKMINSSQKKMKKHKHNNYRKKNRENQKITLKEAWRHLKQEGRIAKNQ